MKNMLMGIASLLFVCAMTGLDYKNVFGQIKSPATNSLLAAGSDQTISWDVTKDSTGIVLLQYSADDGKKWNLIASSGMAAGSYTWAIPPSINSSHCKMRIVKYSKKDFKTVASTGNFSIARMSLTSTINAVFSHRVITFANTGKRHINRIRIFK